MIDLGKWASGGYVISTPITDPDDLDAVGYQGAKAGRRTGSDELSGANRKDIQ